MVVVFSWQSPALRSWVFSGRESEQLSVIGDRGRLSFAILKLQFLQVISGKELVNLLIKNVNSFQGFLKIYFIQCETNLFNKIKDLMFFHKVYYYIIYVLYLKTLQSLPYIKQGEKRPKSKQIFNNN